MTPRFGSKKSLMSVKGIPRSESPHLEVGVPNVCLQGPHWVFSVRFSARPASNCIYPEKVPHLSPLPGWFLAPEAAKLLVILPLAPKPGLRCRAVTARALLPGIISTEADDALGRARAASDEAHEEQGRCFPAKHSEGNKNTRFLRCHIGLT